MKPKILKLAGCVLILAGLAGLIISGILALTMYSEFTPDDTPGELANEIANKLGPMYISGLVGSALFLVGAILLLVGWLVGRKQKKQTTIEAQSA